MSLLCSGGDERFNDYFSRLSQVTRKYKRVVMVGDSMGATAALLFSPLATAVQAFSPQVGRGRTLHISIVAMKVSAGLCLANYWTCGL